MSDYYWQRSTPTELHLDYILQVKYTVHPLTDEVIEVKQTNLHDNVTDHRVFLPRFYHDFLVKFLWRFNLIMELYLEFSKRKAKKFTAFLPRLTKILIHLDNVIEALLRPAVGVDLLEIKGYRSKNFHEYLITEYLIGRHDPTIVQEFRETYDQNIECMSLKYLDWDKYRLERIPPSFEGSEYDYDASDLSEQDLLRLWDVVKDYYARPLDHTWAASCLEDMEKRRMIDEADMDMDVNQADSEAIISASLSVPTSASPPPNQLALKSKRTLREDDDEDDEDMPARKRSVPPVESISCRR